MNKGTLTPRSNEVVDEYRFSGNFGQPDGFGSVLTASVRADGAACLTLEFKPDAGSETHMWSVMLTGEQRNVLGQMLCRHQPRLYERTTPNEARDGQ